MNHFYDRCGNFKPISLIAGPCVFESEDHAHFMVQEIGRIVRNVNPGMNWIYKTSFDKANRTSAKSYRGKGMDEALYALKTIRQQYGVPTLTDVHESWQCAVVAEQEAADVLQIPAFLCRQTDLLQAAAETGLVVNVKKGQFLSPQEMLQVVKKLESFGCNKIMLTERGTTFGYNNLVVDMRGLEIMREGTLNNGVTYPVVMDCTHSVQQPGGMGESSGGQSQYAPVIARAATAVGIAALFMEVHEHPNKAPSDGPNMIPLRNLEDVLSKVIDIDRAVKYTYDK